MAERIPAERITITLDSALYQRLQAVKENLNVSAICRAAIEHAINLEEIKMKALSKKEKAIERLRAERQKSEEEWFDCGKTDGLKDAEELSYEDFEQLEALYESKSELERYDFWLELNRLPEDFHELLEERMDKYLPKPNEKSYLAGWIDGVTDFWFEIKDEI
jgi:post-segregation antitoxin (ccd killing protein)